MESRYVEIIEPFNKKYETWIIAFCPDTDTFFATDERNFFWESNKEFGSEEAAISYFEKHTKDFIDVEKKIMEGIMPFMFDDIDKVYLENTSKWYTQQ